MPSFKPREVEHALTKKVNGTSKPGKHIRLCVLDTDGTQLAVTHISHGNKDIQDPNIGKMAKQLRVDGNLFRGFIACSVDGPTFLDALRAGVAKPSS